jgi:hypothetical protein
MSADFVGGKQGKELWFSNDKVGGSSIIGPNIYY